MALGVTVDFNANLAKFSGQMDKLSGQLDKFQKNTESMASKVNKTLAGLGVGISAAGFGALVKAGIDTADMLSKLSTRTGVAVEELAGLKLAADLSDTSLESVGRAVNKLSIFMGQYSEDAKVLGLTAKNTTDAFLQFADLFSSIDDDARRAALGNKVLGRSYAELAPLLMQGSDALRDQIAQGKEYLPVTTEMANKSAAFNDRITELYANLEKYKILLAGPVVNAVLDFANAVEFANEVTDGFKPFAWMEAEIVAEHGGRLEYLNDEINETKGALARLQNQGLAGSVVDAIFGGATAEELDAKLIKLEKMRDALLAQDKPKPKNVPSNAVIDSVVQTGSGGSSKSGGKSGNNAETNRLKSINEIIAGLQRDIEISKLSEDQQRRMLEMSSALKNARGAEVKTITDLVNAKYDQIEIDRRQSEQWAQLVEDANAYYDLRKEISDFERSNTISTAGLSSLIGKTQDSLTAGIIDEGQAKQLFDQLGRAYNDGFIDPAIDGTDKLSEYAIQGARNMQTAFADFLFDPFEDGMSGMLESFGNTVRRMAADAASAQIMEALFGKTGVSDGGGLLGAAFSSLLGAFGGSASGAMGGSASFAMGGIMTDHGALPLNKYASGGIANRPQLALFGEGSMNEAYVPLPDGRSIPVTMSGNTGNTYNVSISVQGGNSPDETGRRIGEAFIRTIARDEINNQSRPGNRLNPTTKF